MAASLVAQRRLQDEQASAVMAPALNSCGSQALEQGVQQWWYLGLVALWHVASFQIRDRTCVSSIGRWTRRAILRVFHKVRGI